MPALSPTMESGTIASWNVKEGEAFAAGDSIAEIETDKATIAFEAQDDGYVAKILAEAGKGELKIGEPIVVTVEEEEDVGAFKDYTLPEGSTAAVEAAPEEDATPPPPAAALPKEEVAVAAAVPPPPPPTVAPAAVPPAEIPPPPASPSVDDSLPTAILGAPVWGEMAKSTSPLIGILSSSQKQYVELYGSTGCAPLEK